MLDILLRRGTIVDGTGASRTAGDIGIRAGRIVAMGQIAEPAHREIDLMGLTVAPGFVDLHTHYDAQVFWDRSLSPSVFHGVTTVVGGNCGFSIAPLTPQGKDYLMPMLARVEGMPLESLSAGVPWDWTTTDEFLKRIDGKLVPNTGWLIGHSALRIAVMGPDARNPATPRQIEHMAALLHDGLAAGGLGLSSSWSASHCDHQGHAVPSRHASREELIALCQVVGQHEGTTLEFIPSVGKFTEADVRLMADMSRAANRPLNWNSLMIDGVEDAYVRHQLDAGSFAKGHGARIVALTPVDSRHHLINLHSGFIFDALPGWDRFIALAPVERLAQLQVAEYADALELSARGAREGFMRRVADWDNLLLVQTYTERYQQFTGSSFGDIGRALDSTAWKAFVDVAVADQLRTIVTTPDEGQDEATWRRRIAVWRDERALIGASDAGAHLDMSDAFCYPTVLLGKVVRDLNLLPIEEAIAMLTSRPAALYGLKDRGVLKTGAWADLVVFDPAKIAACPVETRFDLPGGAARLFGASKGIHHIFINGAEVLSQGKLTGHASGQVLRSGRDTVTVTTH